MNFIKRSITILPCVLFCASFALAQDNKPEAQSDTAGARDVTVIFQQRQLRFTAPASAQELRLEVFNQAGEIVYDSGLASGAELSCALRNTSGEAVPGGLYAYTLTVKDANSETPALRRGHLILESGRDRLWVTNQGAIGACSPLAGAAMQDTGSNEKLLAAICDADAQKVKVLLLSQSGGADPNARDDDGLTALMYAAMYAGADCVELLLAHGADPIAKSKSDVTALMLAIGQADKVKLLLEQGAEVNARSKQGHTALTIAASRVGTAEVVRLLLDHGADLLAGNVLSAAAQSGDVRVAQLLLKRGADPNK